MKKTLILAAFGLFASLAPPAFANDSPGTAIDAQGISMLNPKESMAVQKTFVIAESADKVPIWLNQQTLKESTPAEKTFVIAESADKVKERPGIAFAAKSTDSSTFIGTKGDYVLTTYDSALVEPGIITAASLNAKSIYVLAKFSADPCWPPAPMTSASASGTSTYTGVEITLKI